MANAEPDALNVAPQIVLNAPNVIPPAKQQQLSSMLDNVLSGEHFAGAQTLLIVPPFIRLTNASLGVHILQACARDNAPKTTNAAGPNAQKVAILYANVFAAVLLGKDRYNAITFSSDKAMLGDRIFSAAAYNKNTFTEAFNAQYQQAPETSQLEGLRHYTLSLEELITASQQMQWFVQLIAQKVVQHQVKRVGCTSMFNQTAASIAFINAIKKQNSDIITLIGGANCAGEMAQGVASLSPHIDYIFSGESETAFVDFLDQIEAGKRPENQIIVGTRCDDLDAIPTPDFADYYQQIDISELAFDWQYVHMPFESSRGCWWGQKYQCTFCGVHELRYRMKSPERVLQQLTEQLKHHRSQYVNFCDDIMPMQYFKTLLPQLQQALPNIRFFIDQKANLSFRKVKALADAGVYDILPGIETLCTELLTAIDKGTTAKQNLQMMRYARGCDLQLSWFFLYGIPGETVASYQKMQQLLPLITHLCPPVNFQDIKLLRFGLYVANPSAYDVANLRPLHIYREILPEQANINQLAYYFEGDYSSVKSDAPQLAEQIAAHVTRWRQAWYGNSEQAVSYQHIPELTITQVSATQFMLTDSRDLDTPHIKREFINEQQAAVALISRPLTDSNWQTEQEWALSNKLAIAMDNWLVPLATTTPALFEYFENKYKPARQYAIGNNIEVAAVN